MDGRTAEFGSAQEKRTAALAAQFKGLARTSPGQLDGSPGRFLLHPWGGMPPKFIPVQVPAFVVDRLNTRASSKTFMPYLLSKASKSGGTWTLAMTETQFYKIALIVARKPCSVKPYAARKSANPAPTVSNTLATRGTRRMS
ncbi:hypothetical protein [Pseudomonas sp. 18175]|uniref:hypothetical protein n=1 Tax=Pseudomonas sp. 18175 TaxID=3390056 RepID=UPI003D1B2444